MALTCRVEEPSTASIAVNPRCSHARPDYPESRHHIDLNGFPRGPKTSTQFGDMFNGVALNRMASHVLPRGRLVDLFKDFVRFAKST
jgi:hypothetical protein